MQATVFERCCRRRRKTLLKSNGEPFVLATRIAMKTAPQGYFLQYFWKKRKCSLSIRSSEHGQVIQRQFCWLCHCHWLGYGGYQPLLRSEEDHKGRLLYDHKREWLIALEIRSFYLGLTSQKMGFSHRWKRIARVYPLLLSPPPDKQNWLFFKK